MDALEILISGRQLKVEGTAGRPSTVTEHEIITVSALDMSLLGFRLLDPCRNMLYY